jgi:hypothetical protein
MKITLKAKSSSGGEPYDVDFLFEEGVLSVHCTCKAGVFGTACKHRLSFLKGDQKMLANPSQADQLATVVQWSEQAGFPSLLQQLDAAKADVNRAQSEFKMMKQRIEESMNHGLSRDS